MHHEREFFLENLSLLLRAGMPVREAVETLREEIRSSSVRAQLDRIGERLDQGENLSAALQANGMLTQRFVSLLRIGEETGQLAEQIRLVVEEQKKEEALRAKVTSALLYPGFVLGAAVIVGTGVLWYAVPKLVSVFESAGGSLPLSTRILISVGHFFSAYGAIAVPSFFAGLALLVYLLFFARLTKVAGERLLMLLPITGSIVREIELTRFGYVLGTLLKAGISVPQALESLEDSTRMVLYKRYYAAVRERVLEGHSLYKSLSDVPGSARFIPPHVARLCSAGERSGALSDTLITVSRTYESKTDRLTGNLSALLEPVIIVGVGLFVALLAVSIIAPIYGLTDQIR